MATLFKQLSVKFYVKNAGNDLSTSSGSLFYMIVNSFNKNFFNGLNSIISFHRAVRESTHQVDSLKNYQSNISEILNLKRLIKIKKVNEPIQIIFPVIWNADENIKSYECVQLNKNFDNNLKQKYRIEKNKMIYLQQRHDSIHKVTKNNDGFFNWESNDVKFISLNSSTAICEFYLPSAGIFAIMAQIDENVLVIY